MYLTNVYVCVIKREKKREKEGDTEREKETKREKETERERQPERDREKERRLIAEGFVCCVNVFDVHIILKYTNLTVGLQHNTNISTTALRQHRDTATTRLRQVATLRTYVISHHR